MTGTIARVTVFYLSQNFMAPTREASWASGFVSFIVLFSACHFVILLYLRTVYLF